SSQWVRRVCGVPVGAADRSRVRRRAHRVLPGSGRPAGDRLRPGADGRDRAAPGRAHLALPVRPRLPVRRAAGQAAGVVTAVVEFSGVDKSFGGNVVLEGVDLAGEPRFTGLIGPNGAGKTTCLNVVSGYLRPDAGDVRLRGRCV